MDQDPLDVQLTRCFLLFDIFIFFFASVLTSWFGDFDQTDTRPLFFSIIFTILLTITITTITIIIAITITILLLITKAGLTLWVVTLESKRPMVFDLTSPSPNRSTSIGNVLILFPAQYRNILCFKALSSFYLRKERVETLLVKQWTRRKLE